MQPDNIVKFNNNYRFYINYQMYILFSILNEDNLEVINNYLLSIHNRYFKIIKNRNGYLYSTIDNRKYVLLEASLSPNMEVNFKDIMNNNIPANDNTKLLNRNNWSELWIAKVDYLEYQVSQLAINHPIIKSSFSYFLGLAENAIEYFNSIDKRDTNLFLVQKRIEYPNTSINYYNPITLVADYKVREVAEYLKSCFFNSKSKDEINDFFSTNLTFSNEEYNLLFVRLLYPSYYFDELSEVLERNKDENCLLKYIEKSHEFEKFLKKCLEEFSRHANMIKIEWLL